MSQLRFPATALWITAAIYAGFALWLGFRPDDLLTSFGIDQTSAAIRTEIRAFYGGVELGIAAAMLLLWSRGELFAGLVIGGIPLACSASGRLIGMTIDGFNSTHLLMAGLEFGGCLFCLLAAATTLKFPEAPKK